MIQKFSEFFTRRFASVQQSLALISTRRERNPIDSFDELCRFVSTRAAFVAQKKLYGYLKTRIGTRYPKMFEEPAFVASVNIAKMHVFAACASDLTIYAIAHVCAGANVDETICKRAAEQCFERALADNSPEPGVTFDPQHAHAEFLLRIAATDWRGAALRRENFDRSPAALVRWAPIAPELKAFDTEIVENSVKFAWIEVRREFESRLDAASARGDLVAALAQFAAAD